MQKIYFLVWLSNTVQLEASHSAHFLWFERQLRFIVLLDIKTLHITVSLSFEPLALKFSFSDLQATHFALSYFRFLTRPKNSKWWQWVVARLAEQLLSNPEARGSNPVISK